jgi:hypothetical protein
VLTLDKIIVCLKYISFIINGLIYQIFSQAGQFFEKQYHTLNIVLLVPSLAIEPPAYASVKGYGCKPVLSMHTRALARRSVRVRLLPRAGDH